MAGNKITDLSAATSVTSDDLLLLVDSPGGTPASKKATVAQLVDNKLDILVGAEQTIPRYATSADWLNPSSGDVTFVYFTAISNSTVTTAKVYTGSQAASSITTIRIGLYTVDGSGDMTLVASTANDATLLTGTYTLYSKALQASYQFVQGQRYAAALIMVATTPAKMVGTGMFASHLGLTPRISGYKSGQSNLSSSQTNAGLTGTTSNGIYIAFA